MCTHNCQLILIQHCAGHIPGHPSVDKWFDLCCRNVHHTRALCGGSLYQLHTRSSPTKTECSCLHGGVIGNGRTRNPVPVPVRVWVHIPGDPQSVLLRNDITILSPRFAVDWALSNNYLSISRPVQCTGTRTCTGVGAHTG